MSEQRHDDSVEDADYLEIQRFLHREAALLDRREYAKWLGLLADDIVYRVTARVTRDAAASDLDYAIVDEDAADLRSRVEQIADPKLTRAENPATFTRRFLSNFLVSRGTSADELVVESNLLVFRSRTNIPEGGFYAGERRDVLRRMNGQLCLARRDVRLDHAVLFDGVVSTIF